MPIRTVVIFQPQGEENPSTHCSDEGAVSLAF
jgi:hypothetical protein